MIQSPYSYAGNNPINKIDVLGLLPDAPPPHIVGVVVSKKVCIVRSFFLDLPKRYRTDLARNVSTTSTKKTHKLANIFVLL